MNDTNIGFVGLGNVGFKVANNIISNGYKLYVHDLDEKKSKNLVSKGGIFCKSIEELVPKVSILITCLPSPKSVKDVLLKCIPLFNESHLWIEMSTTDEQDMKYLSELVFDKKAEVLEAPITGGQHRAESGNISILAGGSRESFERSFPILSCIGHQILHCGDIGKASTLKVVTNYLASINLLALGEALMVCKKYGLDLKTAFEGIKISSGNSFVHETESQVIMNGSYNINFTMDLVCKDVGLFEKLAQDMQVPTEVSPLITKIFKEGREKYGDRAWSSMIVKRLEDACGEDLRASGYPDELVDDTPRRKGYEVIPNNIK